MNTKNDDLKAELYSAMWERIPEIFPKMNFSRYRGYWISPKHLDGSESKRKSKDQTYIHFKAPRTACDQNGASLSLIDLYMEQTGKDFAMALRDLCNLCGVTYTLTKEEEEKQQAERTKREQYKAAAEAFAVALWNNAAATSVLEYLRGRGWTDDEIKAAQFGYIDEEIKDQVCGKFEQLKNALPKASGDSHRLVIPYRHANQVRGFKFRIISTDTTTQTPKYINSIGLQKGSGLFNLRPYLKEDPNPVVIVEGEIDALRATAKEAKNVAATTGGPATEEQIKDAIKRGTKCFVLAFDNDDAGREFTKATAKIIQQNDGSVYVLQYPDGIKDADEFFNSYTVEEWNKRVNFAKTITEFKYFEIIRDLSKKQSEQCGEITPRQRADFFDDVSRLLIDPKTPAQDKGYILDLLKDNEQNLCFSVTDIEEQIKRATEKAKNELRATKVKEIAEKALQDLTAKEANPTKVLKEAGSKITAIRKHQEYSESITKPTESELYSLLGDTKTGLPTNITFKQYGHTENLTLNPGLTFVCGNTGHGKTTFLNCLALQVAKQAHNGQRILYFSYEIDKRRLILDLLNTFNNDPNISETFKPIDAIAEYFRGNDKPINPTHLNRFEASVNTLFRSYLIPGTLTIIDVNFAVEDIVAAVESYATKINPIAIFIDYAQLLYSEEYSRQRTEEIKRIVSDLRELANRTNLPIVLAAQFNRQVNSPIDLDTRNIGEGGDFERMADTCVGLFNLKALKAPTGRNAADEEAAIKKTLNGVGIYPDEIKPIEDKIFVRLLKRRYGYYPLDTVLNWTGATKHIEPNDNREATPQLFAEP